MAGFAPSFGHFPCRPRAGLCSIPDRAPVGVDTHRRRVGIGDQGSGRVTCGVSARVAPASPVRSPPPGSWHKPDGGAHPLPIRHTAGDGTVTLGGRGSAVGWFSRPRGASTARDASGSGPGSSGPRADQQGSAIQRTADRRIPTAVPARPVLQPPHVNGSDSNRHRGVERHRPRGGDEVCGSGRGRAGGRAERDSAVRGGS